MPKKPIAIQGPDGLGIQTVGELVNLAKGEPGIITKPTKPTYPVYPPGGKK